MPEKVLKKIHAQIKPQWKACFYAALLVGLLAHIYKIANWLPNWDGMVFRYDPQNMIGLGRWFLPVACAFTSFYDLPFLNGILAIVFHALSAVYICRILHVQKKVTAALIGAVVVSLPTVTSVMMYSYVADGYSIALFLATLAAWYMTREKPRYLLAAVLITLSAGIYQAYITVVIMLILLKLIDDLVYGQVATGAIWKKIVHLLLTGILGVAAYALILKIMLKLFCLELMEYQGIDTAASLAGLDLLASLYVTKETFIKSFFDISGGLSVHVILNCLIAACTIWCYIRSIVKGGLYKRGGALLTVVFLGVMLLFGAGALAFANAQVDYHNLMRMGYGVFYLFFLVQYERYGNETEKQTCVKRWTVLLIAAILVANHVVIANVSYHKAQMAYEKSYSVLIRIADRIEQTPGAENCDKILVLGALEDSEHYSANLAPEITGITDGFIIRADDETVGQSVLASALKDYCGKDYDFVSGEERKTFTQKEEVKELEGWPAKNCIAVVGDTLVIKLGQEGE